MTVDQAVNLLVTVTLVEMMVAVGLGVKLAELAAVARDWRLVTKAALANYLCVPAVTVGLLLLFRPLPMVSAGFLILAVCPGEPFTPGCTKLAKGNVAAAVGLMVMLAASWAAGWLLGGPGSGNRRASMLTASLRNVGVGLIVATGNFGVTAAVTAVLAYGIFEIVGSLLLALTWGRVELGNI